MNAVVMGFRVTGRVQGVGFRWWVRHRGREFELVGSVWNCRDGSVQLDVRGPRGAVEAFRRVLEQGPPAARVESVVECAPTATAEWDDFRIGGPVGGD